MTTKMTTHAIAILADAIRQYDTPEIRDRYRAGDFPNAAITKDIDTRYHWDIFHHAGGYNIPIFGRGDTLYNEGHITTALAHIIPPL